MLKKDEFNYPEHIARSEACKESYRFHKLFSNDFKEIPALEQFQAKFQTEKACADYLFTHKWPNGFVCPRLRATSKGIARNSISHEG